MNPASTPPGSPGNPLPASRHVRLGALAPVGLDHDACLHLHKTWVGCTSCRTACPQGCLSLEAGHVSLNASRCTGCGRCAVACPTDALAVDGFALDEWADAAPDQTFRITCRGSIADDGRASTVPCLAGLSVRSLLTLLWLHPASRIELLESSACPVCGEQTDQPSPAQRLLAAVREVLFGCALPLDRIEVLTVSPSLPNGNQKTVATSRPIAGRRSFFAGLGRAVSQGIVRKASGTSALIDQAHLPRQPRQAVPYTGGHETRLLMLHLAAQGGAVPVHARLPRVTVNQQCCGHAACSRLCPTGALRSSVHQHAQALSFDAWRCIDCAACRTACPEKALHYQARELRAFEPDPALLSRVELAHCTRCNEEFHPPDSSGLCPGCRKSAALSQAGFSMFATFRQPDQTGSTGPPGR